MAESKNDDIVEIVHEVWPSKFQTVGKGTVRRLVGNAAGSESARSGDKIDVASTLEAIKADGVDAPRRHRCARVEVLKHH